MTNDVDFVGPTSFPMGKMLQRNLVSVKKSNDRALRTIFFVHFRELQSAKTWNFLFATYRFKDLRVL